MKPIKKLHNIVISIRASANRATWFKQKTGKLISLDNRTRWNSWFLMLSAALEDKVKSALSSYVEHYQKEISKEDILSIDDWIHLRTIH